MNIYVAGKIGDYKRVREVQELCRQYGHVVTWDWTFGIEEFIVDGVVGEAPTISERRQHAFDDLVGVSAADCLIALGYPGLCGTLVEIGYALAHGIPVLLLTWQHKSVFFELPQVTALDDAEVLERHLAVL